jgi:hypothetical protein
VADLRAPSDGRAPHDQHDPELIAGLLDPDQPEVDRVSALGRIERCPECAALHEDLLTLATATAKLPTPVRRRDYTLTPEIAAALVQRVAREPDPARARLTGEMVDANRQTPTHASHDRLLVASVVDRSVSETERDRAEAQMAGCSDCRRLHDDLVALSEATRSLPVPPRPRDFTLSPADAQRLRSRGWRRILAAFGSPRDVFSRPLAVGLTTLGLAGLLVASIPGALTGQPTAGPAFTSVGSAPGDGAGGAATNPETLAGQPSAAPAAATTGPAAAQAAPAPAASGGTDSSTESVESDRLFAGVGESSPLAGEPEGRAPVDLYGNSLAAGTPGPSALLLVALLLLLVGLGLFTLRWVSRRLGDG